MTPEELEAIKARSAAVPEAEAWSVAQDDDLCYVRVKSTWQIDGFAPSPVEYFIGDVDYGSTGDGWGMPPTLAAFFAHARADIDTLMAEIERLRKGSA